MTAPKEETVAQLPPKPVRILLGLWLLLCLLPGFAAMFGFNFVPTTEWVSTSSIPGLAAGLSTAALMSWAILREAPTCGSNIIFGVLFSPLLSYFLGKSAVVIAVPMILATVGGHHVELPFTVIEADQYGDRRCRSPIEFQGLPFFFDRVCGFSKDFRQGLTPGSRVVVTGRGTSLGVFAESLRRVE
ncbi:hypothetical protein [Phyllobacterium endophyticum]|uniref:hypothetical protein n=1 Tax=Phyllobacterium endophyticum TaxID=1149773 RepID=UPI0011CA331B|nr:hypothetical protein [Phyllobacterium endophyticum]TXR46610.1 hypothetical protein FVA77_24115 [Phyllobacterium endophyticum]